MMSATMTALPSKGPNSPFSAGGRTLVARTCAGCGELADGESFPVLNAGRHNECRRRTCHTCTNLAKKRDREERGIGVPPPRPPETLQTRKRQQWSKEDDAYLRGHVGSSSYEQMAVALGRSLLAVYKRRDILGLPRVRKSHRVEQPWSIHTTDTPDTQPTNTPTKESTP